MPLMPLEDILAVWSTTLWVFMVPFQFCWGRLQPFFASLALFGELFSVCSTPCPFCCSDSSVTVIVCEWIHLHVLLRMNRCYAP